MLFSERGKFKQMTTQKLLSEKMDVHFVLHQLDGQRRVGKTICADHCNSGFSALTSTTDLVMTDHILSLHYVCERRVVLTRNKLHVTQNWWLSCWMKTFGFGLYNWGKSLMKITGLHFLSLPSSHACHMPHLSPHPWLDHCNNAVVSKL